MSKFNIGAVCGKKKPRESDEEGSEQTEAAPVEAVPGAVLHVTSKDEFTNFLRGAGDKLVVVDFFATWCGPCRNIAPQIEEAAKKHRNVVFLKVDVDELQDVAMEYQVTAMPTFCFLKNSKKLDSFEGANITKVVNLIKKYK